MDRAGAVVAALQPDVIEGRVAVVDPDEVHVLRARDAGIVVDHLGLGPRRRPGRPAVAGGDPERPGGENGIGGAGACFLPAGRPVLVTVPRVLRRVPVARALGPVHGGARRGGGWGGGLVAEAGGSGAVAGCRRAGLGFWARGWAARRGRGEGDEN